MISTVHTYMFYNYSQMMNVQTKWNNLISILPSIIGWFHWQNYTFKIVNIWVVSVSNQLSTKFCPRSHNLNLEWSEDLVLSLKCTSISLCQECKLSGSKTWFQTRVITCAAFAAKVRLSTTSTNFRPAVKIPMLNYRPSPPTQLPVCSVYC